MPNQFGYACPQCHSTEAICVVASIWILLVEDGSIPDEEPGFGDHEWDDASVARCASCDWIGRVKDLTGPAPSDDQDERRRPMSDNFGTVFGLKPMTDAHGHTWRVIWDGWAVGFRITHPNGTEKIICLNPSGESDDGMANAFVYIGAPAEGDVITSVTPFEHPGDTPLPEPDAPEVEDDWV